MHLPSGLKNVSSKDVDKALDEIDKLTESWHQRLSVHNLSFAKRYLEMEIGLGLEVTFKERGSKHFVAFFKRKSGHSRGRWHRVASHDDGATNIDVCTDASQTSAYWNDGVVFVDDVALVNTPEGIAPASFVWLQSADDFFNVSTSAIKKFNGLGTPGEVVCLPVYWEVRFIDDILRDSPGSCVEQNKTNGQIIERGSEIVKDVTDIAAPTGWDVLDYMQFMDFYSGLRLTINDDSVRITRLKRFNFDMEIVKVFLGPVDLNTARD